MPACPQCSTPLRLQRFPRGLTCPHCRASLQRVYWHSFLLYGLVGALATTTGYVLRRVEANWVVAVVAPPATWFLGWATPRPATLTWLRVVA